MSPVPPPTIYVVQTPTEDGYVWVAAFSTSADAHQSAHHYEMVDQCQVRTAPMDFTSRYTRTAQVDADGVVESSPEYITSIREGEPDYQLPALSTASSTHITGREERIEIKVVGGDSSAVATELDRRVKEAETWFANRGQSAAVGSFRSQLD